MYKVVLLLSLILFFVAKLLYKTFACMLDTEHNKCYATLKAMYKGEVKYFHNGC